LFDAKGEEVAKVFKAKLRGVSEEVEKSIEEKLMPPDVTSGTPERVVMALLQVMEDWIWFTEVCTSAGRVVLPTIKQGVTAQGGATVGAVVIRTERIVGGRRGEDYL